MSALDNLMQDKPPQKKPMGCLLALLIGINCLFSMFAFGQLIITSTCSHTLVSWLIFFIGIAVPFFITKKLKKTWHWAYLWMIAWASIFFLGIFVSSVLQDTEQCKAERERQRQESISQAQNAETPQAPETQQAQEVSDYQIGDSFLVGYTRYQVQGISWKVRLGNEYFGTEADSRYLLVKVLVKNEDKENRMIPTFKLVDENGATYDESADRMYLGKEAVLLSNLNPGVQKKATLVFDVPPEHHYKLVVSGGYWSGQDALVKLN